MAFREFLGLWEPLVDQADQIEVAQEFRADPVAQASLDEERTGVPEVLRGAFPWDAAACRAYRAFGPSVLEACPWVWALNLAGSHC